MGNCQQSTWSDIIIIIFTYIILFFPIFPSPKTKEKKKRKKKNPILGALAQINLKLQLPLYRHDHHVSR